MYHLEVWRNITMARKGHKFLCVVLCVALILTTALVGAFSAFAVTDEEAETVGASGDVVYVKVNNGWSNLHCYMWTDGQGNNAQWPGAAMQAVSDGVYAYTVTGNFSKIIFNNGNSIVNCIIAFFYLLDNTADLARNKNLM